MQREAIRGEALGDSAAGEQPERMRRRRITQLPGAIVGRLRSGTILSSVAQIAEELVCNSLDAGATKIEVAVDGEASYIRVDDDGCGISRDDLTFVGERHATSKLHSLDELEEGVATLGFRGEALSSLCDLALVKITSRCRGMPNSYCKILKGSTTISIGLCSEQRTHGTTVIARDMFYNQPVRRRLLQSRSITAFGLTASVLDSYKKTLQAVKECVLRLVLVHPQVSFCVKDPARKELLLQSKRGAALKVTLRDMFGEETLSKLREIDYAQGHLRLSGYLSRIYHSHSSKALQYLYINRRYVLKTVLHKLLNSWSGLNADDGNLEGSLGQTKFKAERRKKVELATRKHLFPAFVLNMSCPSSGYDITFEPSKTLIEFKDWSPVVSFVRSVLDEVWGNQSAGRKRDSLQAIEPFCQPPLKNTTTNGNLLQEHSSHLDRREKEFPSMPARRAILQRYYDPSRPSSKTFGSPETAVATHVASPGKRSSALVASACLPHEMPLEIPPYSEMQTTDPSISVKRLRTDYTNPGNLDFSPGKWTMKTCKQRSRANQALSSRVKEYSSRPKLLDPFWFPDPSQENMLDLFTPSFCSDGMSTISNESDQGVSSPVGNSRRHLAGSLSPLDAFESRSFRLTQKSKTRAQSPAFFDDVHNVNESRHLSNADDIDKPCQFWEADDCGRKSPLWAGIDNITRSEKILDTSDFFPENGSWVPDTFPGKDLIQKRKWAEFDGDATSMKLTAISKTPAKRKRVRFMDEADSFGVGNCSILGSPSCRIDAEGRLNSLQTSGLVSECWRMEGIEGADHLATGAKSSRKSSVGENCGDWYLPENQGSDLGRAQVHDCDIELDLCRPRSRRRLYCSFENGSGDLDGGADQYSTKQLGAVDSSPCSSPSTFMGPGRVHSAPPIRRSPRRHGALANPLESPSTKRRKRLSSQDSENIQTDNCLAIADPMGTALEEIQKNALTRDEPGMEWEGVINIPQGEPGLAIMSASSTEQNAKCKHRVSADMLKAVACPRAVPDADLDPQCKYRSAAIQEEAELPEDTVRAIFREWSNPCMRKDDDILDLSLGVLGSNSSSLLPRTITKDVLRQARVLQQVDAKFIAAVSCGVLLLIDQHAADERVRLEELREDVLEGDSVKQSSLLSGTQDLILTFTEQQALQTYCQQIQDWGWRFKIPSARRPEVPTEGMCKVFVSAVPSILDVSLTTADLAEYLRQLSDTQGSSAAPPAVIRLLNYKACRGAIMFGDTLLPAECGQLIEHLKRTRLCFQCAHGRPTMVPLVDLQALHRRFDRSTYWVAGHGPREKRHVSASPSLQRAQLRLRQARGLLA